MAEGTIAGDFSKDLEFSGTKGVERAKNPRRDRLKLALRENLKRRKSQARGRSDVTTVPSDSDDVSPHDDGGKKPGK